MCFLLSKLKLNLIILFSAVLFIQSVAQNRTEALDLQEQAKNYFHQQDIKRAIIFAIKAISKDSS